MATGNKPCIIAKCDKITPPNSRLPICPNCRATIGRWEFRRPGEIQHRKDFLVKSQTRMAEVTGGKRRKRPNDR